MTGPEAASLLQRMRMDAERLAQSADPLLAGQCRTLAARIDVLLALLDDVAAGPAAP